MPIKSRGADALVGSLRNAGITRIFTLSGNHIMPVFDAVLDAGIDLIHTRHEAAAVHMADAWARITGEPGVALVTGGPGHANAVAALYTADLAESPLVLLSGHAPNHQLGMGAFQEMRQAEMAAPVTKAAWTCRSAGAVAGDIARALRVARSGRTGPVHLSLPSDVLEGSAEVSGLPRLQDFAPERADLESGAAISVRERLSRAARPLILAGPACMTRNGRERLALLENACGVPVLGMESPRGIADPSLGAFGEMLEQADCVLLLGKRLDFTLKFGKSPAFRADCEFLQIDAEEAEIDRARRAVGARLAYAAVADVFSSLAALTAVQGPARGDAAWLSDVRAAVAYRPAAWDSARAGESGKLHPVQALRPFQALLDSHPDSVLVSDGGEFGQWAQACLQAPYRVINGIAGAIGSALPFALAARCAQREAPVIAALGDGTFGFHMAELDTAVTYKLPFIAVIGNDARWNAEYQIQVRDYGPQRLIGCELRRLRYDLIASAFGAYGEQVTDGNAVSAAAQRALESGLPACLDIMIEGLPAPQIARAGSA